MPSTSAHQLHSYQLMVSDQYEADIHRISTQANYYKCISSISNETNLMPRYFYTTIPNITIQLSFMVEYFRKKWISIEQMITIIQRLAICFSSWTPKVLVLYFLGAKSPNDLIILCLRLIRDRSVFWKPHSNKLHKMNFHMI